MYFPGIQLEIYSSVVSPTWGIDGIITSFFFNPIFLLVCDMFIHFHHFSKAFSKTLPRIWRGSNSKHSAGIGKCCHPWIDHLVGRLLTSSSVGQDLWDAQHPQWNFHHADVSEEAFRSRLYFCHLVVAMAWWPSPALVVESLSPNIRHLLSNHGGCREIPYNRDHFWDV